MKNLKQIIGIFTMILVALSIATGAFAQDGMEGISLGDLLNLEITTAGKKAEKVSEIPASVVIITREDIEAYGYSTLPEILENIPGMYVINDYSWDGYHKFGVRGFWNVVANDDLMIYVNGVDQINNVNSNYPLHKIAVPVEAIDRIEVVRGPMSVIYGSGAFFGIINIITNSVSEEESANIVSSSIGTHDTRKLFLKTSGQEGNLKYAITGSFFSTSGIDKPYKEMTDDTSSMPAGGTGDLLEGEEKYFNFSGEFNNFYSDISYIETENEIYLFYPGVDQGSTSSVITTNAVIGYKNSLSEMVSVDARAGYYRSRHKVDYDWLFKNFYGYQTIPSNAYDISLTTFITPSDNFDITAGLKYRAVYDIQNRLHLPSAGLGIFYNTTQGLADDEEIVTRALFTQINYKPFSNLKFVAGIRFEQMEEYVIRLMNADESIGEPAIVQETSYSQDQWEVIPRVAAIYNVNDNNILKFLYGQATNQPSWWQAEEEFDNGRDPDLEPEKIKTAELNYIATPFPSLVINASIFYNKLENLIVRTHGIDENGDYYSGSANAGEMETLGAELTVRAKPLDNMNLELSGTWQNTEDKKYPDIDPGYSPDFLGYLKVSYHFPQGISLGITGNYVSSMKAGWASDPDGTGARIGEDADSYFSLGANLRFNNLFGKGLYLNIRGSNLLDEDIRYPATTNNNGLFPKGTLGAGRSLLATVGWKF
ncbi:TonB-dependent receptor [Desulfococcaceae bacterium HSG8]|nr:TonB-dependent receptor [Desulfococcaceae bacterium HSG8]